MPEKNQTGGATDNSQTTGGEIRKRPNCASSKPKGNANGKHCDALRITHEFTGAGRVYGLRPVE